MPNKIYCQFKNTYLDLCDCALDINKEVSKEENIYRQLLVQKCRDIVKNYKGEIPPSWYSEETEVI